MERERERKRKENKGKRWGGRGDRMEEPMSWCEVRDYEGRNDPKISLVKRK